MADRCLPTTTSAGASSADLAVLPVGSFEQHGTHLPLATDTVIASELARRIAADLDALLLPPVCFSCSHEHAGFAGTVSLTAGTLIAVVTDIAADLERGGIKHLVVVNGHGGNSVLTNVAQEANVCRTRILLYPNSYDWTAARIAAGCATSTHEDMHAGEAETSILLYVDPALVSDGWEQEDCLVDDRARLTLVAMHGYSKTGVIGAPSFATAAKGQQLLDALVEGAIQAVAVMRG